MDEEAIQALLTGTNQTTVNSTTETISKQDALYGYLGLVAQDSSAEPIAEVGCIALIYPFVLFRYDNEQRYMDQVSVQGNADFAALLDTLEADHSIGLSYPISGILDDGTTIVVENNEQLQKSLETCIEEELELIIGTCNAIVEDCIWKVAQSVPEESPYIDSFFTLDEDGSMIFSILQPSEEEQELPENEIPAYETKVGTWIFYFIGADLHLNMHFGPLEISDTGEIISGQEVKQDWNFDWKINHITENRIEIENEQGTEYTLEKECEEEREDTPIEGN